MLASWSVEAGGFALTPRSTQLSLGKVSTKEVLDLAKAFQDLGIGTQPGCP